MNCEQCHVSALSLTEKLQREVQKLVYPEYSDTTELPDDRTMQEINLTASAVDEGAVLMLMITALTKKKTQVGSRI
jgi:hypothetical protein